MSGHAHDEATRAALSKLRLASDIGVGAKFTKDEAAALARLTVDTPPTSETREMQGKPDAGDDRWSAVVSGTALTPRVLVEVLNERERQERKGAEHRARGQEHWRSCADPLLPTERKLAILGEEFGEVAKALNEEWIGEPANLREELLHTAAVAVAWAESLAAEVSGGTTETAQPSSPDPWADVREHAATMARNQTRPPSFTLAVPPERLVALFAAFDAAVARAEANAKTADHNFRRAEAAERALSEYQETSWRDLRASVGLLEEALRAIRDTPRAVLWKVYDIAARALAGVETGPPGNDLGDASGVVAEPGNPPPPESDPCGVETGPGKEHGNAGDAGNPRPDGDEA